MAGRKAGNETKHKRVVIVADVCFILHARDPSRPSIANHACILLHRPGNILRRELQGDVEINDEKVKTMRNGARNDFIVFEVGEGRGRVLSKDICCELSSDYQDKMRQHRLGTGTKAERRSPCFFTVFPRPARNS